MKRSAEIEKLIRDGIAAFARGDLAFAERTTSKQPGLVSIGTDASEYVLGYEQLINMARGEMDSMPRLGQRIGEIRAYEQGDVGWADSTGYFESGGKSVAVRNTSVFLREAGEWHTIQSHTSIGVPNDRMFDQLFQGHKAAT